MVWMYMIQIVAMCSEQINGQKASECKSIFLIRDCKLRIENTGRLEVF